MRFSTRLILLVITFIVVFLSSLAVKGATYIVHPDGTGDFVTIQGALDAAASGDTILLGPGTFAGPGNKNLDTNGKAVVITSVSGAENTIIDCEDDGRGFFIHSGEGPETLIRGVKVLNGEAAPVGDKGGAVYCDNASPTILENIFESNYAQEGGAIYLSGSNARIIRNQFLANNCWMYCDLAASPTSDESPSGAGLQTEVSGGAIYCADSDLTIIDNYFYKNQNSTYGYGSGLTAFGSTLTIIGNEFKRNGSVHDDYAAALYADSCDVLIEGNYVHLNAGWTQAGIFLEQCTGSVRANWLDHNGAQLGAGGIQSTRSNTTMDYNLLTRNTFGGFQITESSGLVHRNIIARTQPGSMTICSEFWVIDSPGAPISNNVLYEGYAEDYCCYGTEMNVQGGFDALQRGNIFVNSHQPAMVSCGYSLLERPAGVDTVHVTDNYFYGNLQAFLSSCFYFTAKFADPLFCDPDNDNWFLQPESPCEIDTLIPGGGSGGNDLYKYGLIGALPVGCGTPDVLFTGTPPDSEINYLLPGDVYPLSGFAVTNLSGQEAPVYYELRFGGDATPCDQGDPLAFNGVTPVLQPGETFTPPPPALIVPDFENQAVSTVTYLVAYAPALNMPDTFVTTITFSHKVPVMMQSFAGSWGGDAVSLEWRVAPGVVDVEHWKVFRSRAGTAFVPVLDAPLPGSARSFTDKDVERGVSYAYRLVATTALGDEIAGEVQVNTPASVLALYQNVPNPFNPATTISYSLPDQARVTLTIFNVEGRRVATLVDGIESAGAHAVEWDGRDHMDARLSSGVYFYRLQAGKQSLTRKLVIMK